MLSKLRLLILLVFALASNQLYSEVISRDITFGGAVNAKDIWFSFKNNNYEMLDGKEWDLAFHNDPRQGGIFINDAKSIELYDFGTDWNATPDTTQKSKWSRYYNSTLTWNTGAFNKQFNANGLAFNYGWGSYDPSAHAVIGTNVFVLKLAPGVWKKMFVEVRSTTSYTFKYSNLDGSELVSDSITSNYAKLYKYYNLTNKQVLDREPALTEWDVNLSRYKDSIYVGGGQSMYINLIGLRQNPSVKIAKVGAPTHAEAKVPAYSTFRSEINTIGTSFSAFDEANKTYSVVDTNTYFVQRYKVVNKKDSLVGDLYKLVFTKHDYNANELSFEYEPVQYSSVETEEGTVNFTVYPNILDRGQNANLIYMMPNAINSASITICDINGNKFLNSELNSSNTSVSLNLNELNLASGVYIAAINVNGKVSTQKFVIK